MQANDKGTRPAKVCQPFAALPHAIVRDPRLKPRDIMIAACVLRYARDKATCWPSNRRLAEDCRCGLRTVQYALAHLEKAGWIVTERTEANRTGRIIILAWRSRPDGGVSLGKMLYGEYLKTKWWAKVRDEALSRSANACGICNSQDELNVHHKTYDRLGCELPDDLIVLCRTCHKIFHENGRLATDTRGGVA